MRGSSPPVVRGNFLIASSERSRNMPGAIPSFVSTGVTTVSGCANSATITWSGVTSGLPIERAVSPAAATASWVLVVHFFGSSAIGSLLEGSGVLIEYRRSLTEHSDGLSQRHEVAPYTTLCVDGRFFECAAQMYDFLAQPFHFGF